MITRCISALFRTRVRAAATIVFWVVLTGTLSSFAPHLGSVEDNSTANLPPAGASSMQARELARSAFPGHAAMPAMIVIKGQDADPRSAAAAAHRISTALSKPDAPRGVRDVVSSETNPHAAASLVSHDRSVQLVLVSIAGDPSSDAFIDTVTKVRAIATHEAHGATVAVSGPAGISADAVKVFSSADLTLLLATVLLVLVLLLVIYRSPVMAFIPLFAAFIAMRVSQCTGALLAQAGLVHISSQTASIMTVLLFGVGTDYALIITARYREQLAHEPDRYRAMQAAMQGVGETILSSASTIVLSMLALLIAVSPALHGFGPYFALGVTTMALVAFTLIPAATLLLGQAVFWPMRTATELGTRSWGRIANMVIGSPIKVGAATIALLAVLATGMLGYTSTFDMVSGFRVDTQSEQGMRIVQDAFGPGQSAPTDLLVTSRADLHGSRMLDQVAATAAAARGVVHVSPRPQVSADGHTALFQVVLDHDPYSTKALDTMEPLQRSLRTVIKRSDRPEARVLLGGETAQTADIRTALDRDTRYVVPLVLMVVGIILAILLRSLLAPLYLVATLALSYVATLGATTFFSISIMGDDGIGNRVAIYIFVFLVALGVDYNIFIMSRFRQELEQRSPREAIRAALTHTGGVVSSAGLILAATFSVLMTQPIRELFQFGFAMTFGILLDTFVIRPLLVPAIVTLLGGAALWPTRITSTRAEHERQEPQLIPSHPSDASSQRKTDTCARW